MSISSTPSARWLLDYDALEILANEIMADIRGSKNSTGGAGASKGNALIRKKINQYNTRLNGLADDLSRMKLDPVKYEVAMEEIARRGDMLAQLEQRQAAINNATKDLRSSFAALPLRASATNETEETRSLGTDQMISLQQQKIKDQEAFLQNFAASINNVQEIGIDIHDELDVHSGLLDDIEEGTERTDAKIKRTTKTLDKLSMHASGKSGLCIVVFLIIVIVVLLLL